MALTKVRVPVSDISQISRGTSDIDIPTASDDIIVTRAGTVVATFGSTGLVFSAGQLLDVDDIDTETIDFATASGASATVGTTLTALDVGTTSAHLLNLKANSVTGLSIATDGKVTLGVQGTATTHLINKSYVDTAIALLPASADFVFSPTSPGSLVIPTDGADDFIINWGITASLNNTKETVTFDTAFPNAVLGAFATDVIDATKEASSHVDNVTITGMDVVQSGSSASRPVYWLAFGY